MTKALKIIAGNRKVMSSRATQYVISKFELEKTIVIGTCAGINEAYKIFDIVIPTKTVQYDCTVKEIEPLIKEKFTVEIKDSNNPIIIGTGDKPVVIWNDFELLQRNKIDIADCESGAIAYICKLNNINCSIIKGISDVPLNKDQQEAYEEQFAAYERNTSIIMQKILDNYLQNELYV